MTILNKILIVLLALIVFNSCRGDDEMVPTINTTPEVNFLVKKTNSDSDYESKVVKSIVREKNDGWMHFTSGFTVLRQQVLFDLVLENGDTLNFGFKLVNHEENTDLLALEEEGPNYWSGTWDYISFEDEKNRFFSDFENIEVYVNNNVAFYDTLNDDFDIIEVEAVMVDGVEKSLVTIHLSGKVFGWFDPQGQSQEVYEIVDGVITGVFE